MPLFFTPTPRKFTYQPRFYDPEKEEWEARKKKYAADQQHEVPSQYADSNKEDTQQSADGNGVDLAYFERRLRQIDSNERKKKSKLQFSDFFRKRETPTFHYEPRFSSNPDGTTTATNSSNSSQEYKSKHKIARRFDIADSDYMKPVSAGKIMLYALLTAMLLMWILL